MQLHTIGLFALEADGTKKTDEAGQPIPTYSNDDVQVNLTLNSPEPDHDLSPNLKP